jgi:hypothetical protein
MISEASAECGVQSGGALSARPPSIGWSGVLAGRNSSAFCLLPSSAGLSRRRISSACWKTGCACSGAAPAWAAGGPWPTRALLVGDGVRSIRSFSAAGGSRPTRGLPGGRCPAAKSPSPVSRGAGVPSASRVGVTEGESGDTPGRVGLGLGVGLGAGLGLRVGAGAGVTKGGSGDTLRFPLSGADAGDEGEGASESGFMAWRWSP